MKCYLLTIFLYDDYANVIVSKEGNCKPDDSVQFDIRTWFNEPDWHKIRKVIAFFDAQYVHICPRFNNADEFTSPEPVKELGYNETTGQTIEYRS